MARELSIRTARRSDLEALIKITLAAFADDPQWQFLFPAHEFSLDQHYRRTDVNLSETFDSAEAGAVEIIVVQESDDAGYGSAEVIAYSVWQDASSWNSEGTLSPLCCLPCMTMSSTKELLGIKQDADVDRSYSAGEASCQSG